MKYLLLAAGLVLAGVAEAAPAAGSSRAGAAAFALSGRIVDHKGAPVPGAVVAVRGTRQLTTTNAAGGFLLTLEQAELPVLLVTCQGYQPQTLTVQARNAVAITLYPIGVAAPLGTAAATGATAEVPNTALIVADVQPAYPGGVEAYRNYLKNNAHYPEKAKASGRTASVYVGFNVDEVGRILDAQVLKGAGDGFDEEALRLIRLMPWWTPGLLDGKPVKVACTLRINFAPEVEATSTNYNPLR